VRIEFIRSKGDWPPRLLCVTHSDRPTEPEHCSLNFLETRYSNHDRLPAKVPFESFPHVSTQQPYKGGVTIWDVQEPPYRNPRLIAALRAEEYKPQHALWYHDKLWILGVDRLEIYDSHIARLATVWDPWLSGGHTINPDGKGHLLITCSASDSVLIIDEKSLAVRSALRLPETIYGRNVELHRNHSVVEHYIPNDLQLTHINCAAAWRGGIVVSTLIQGAIGWFDGDAAYRELLRGFVGCHGVRVDSRTDRLYFSDSCLGAVVLLNEQFGIDKRVDVDSRWLHDALQMDGRIFAVSITDSNRVRLLDIESRETISEMPGSDFGMGTQFLSYCGS
jgi:hypothetical protein